jgi:hypothetical protein
VLNITPARSVFTVLFLSILCHVRQAQASQPPVLLEPKVDAKSAFRCRALLDVEPSTVAVGGTVRVTCEARGDGRPMNLFNPFLSESHRLSAQVILVSADGNSRHELLRSLSTQEKCASRDWVYVRSGQSIGRELTLHIVGPDSGDSGIKGARELKLAAGEYYLQAIYRYWLVASWPNDPSRANSSAEEFGNEPRPWEHGMNMDNVLAISDPVKLIVTDGDGTRPVPAPGSESPVALQLRPPTRPLVVKESRAEAEIRLVNRSDSAKSFFNPLLDPWLSSLKPVDLAVYTLDGVYLGNYIEEEQGHSRPVRRSDWVHFAPGGSVTVRFTFNPRHIPLADVGPRGELPPGKYVLQLRAHQALVSPMPAVFESTRDSAHISRDFAYRMWKHSFPGPEICRSNRVELEILPRTGD